MDLEVGLAELIERIQKGDQIAFDEFAKLLGLLSMFYLLGSGVGLHGVEATVWVTKWIVTVTASVHTAKQPYIHWLENQFDQFVHHEFFYDAAQLQDLVMCRLPVLPKEVRAHAVLRPRQRVSGDIILTATDGGDVWFGVGDVTGHGTAAALFGAFALQLLQMARLDPGVLAHRQPLVAAAQMVNRELMNNNIGRMALPVIFARAIPKERRVEVLNCGSPASPYFLRKGSVAEIESGGLPLGYFPEPPLSLWSQTWEDGDLLVIPTDGLVEQTDSSGNMFTNQQLAQCLGAITSSEPAAVASNVFETLDRYRGGSLQTDDQSLLVIRLGDLSVNCAIDPFDRSNE